MASKKKKAQTTAFDAAEFIQSNPYIQRLVQDAELRDNVRAAVESARKIQRRLNGKTPSKALLNDKKLQNELRTTVSAVKNAAGSLSQAPKKRARKGLSFGRGLLIAGVGAGLALVGSEKLRSKVLDTLFGAEEEFEYTPPAGATAPAQASTPTSPPVSAA
jgi:hypothetical protein